MIEPVRRHGGIVRSYEHYSPLGWAQRDPAAVAALHVPSEEARADTFFAVRKQFMEALLLRMAELTEPGKQLNIEEYQRLARLLRDVILVERVTPPPIPLMRALPADESVEPTESGE